MITLYEQNPKVWDDLAAKGKTAIAEMARHFEYPCDMEDALGYEPNGTVANWVSGRNGCSNRSERRARDWLNSLNKATQETPQQKQSGSLLLVAGMPDKLEKARKVLELIGCEVEDI